MKRGPGRRARARGQISQQGGVARRFWRLVRKGPGPNDCWVWQGQISPKGYGLFTVGEKDIKAHRWSYAHAHGTVPEGLILRHTCDNPPCVNPAHLVPGSYQDNSDDMVERGRTLQGEAHPRAKLTIELVRLIRLQHLAGRTTAEMARAFHVSERQIGRIVRGESWSSKE